MKTLLISLFILPFISMAQNVGIGTQTPHPSAILDVSSSTKGMLVPRMRTVDREAIQNPEEGLFVFDINTLSFWVFRGLPDGGWVELSHGFNGPWTKKGDYQIHTTELSANVGIGTSNPSQVLELNENIGLANTVNMTMAIGGVKYGQIGIFRYLNGYNFEMKTIEPEGRINLKTSATELSVMHSLNSVVIGPTPYFGSTLILSDREKDPELQFVRMYPDDGNSYYKGFVQISGNNLRIGTNSENTEGKFVVRTAGTDRVAVDKNGYMGIGTLNPAYRLQVGTAGDGSQARANAWNVFSDERYKTNIEEIPNALDKIDELHGYYYNWKTGDDKTRQAGLMAQEVEKVLPEIVSTDAEGYKSVEYGKMNALLLQAIKEQQQQITELKQKLDQLSKGNPTN